MILMLLFLILLSNLQYNIICSSIINYALSITNHNKGIIYPSAEIENYVKILTRIDNCTSFSEVYSISEEIPAIKLSVDKAMRIVHADAEDAKLAANAIKQLAILSSIPANMIRDEIITIQNGNRRFEQLAECVELCISSVRITDLIKYSWALTMLGVQSDSTKYSNILSEYSKRFYAYKLFRNNQDNEINAIEEEEDLNEKTTYTDGLSSLDLRHSNLSIVDLASIIWTMGCIKDVTGTSNQSLIKDVAIYILKEMKFHYNPEHTHFTSRLSIRVLWSLALHGIYIDDLMQRCLTICFKEEDSLSITSSMSLIWCFAEFKDKDLKLVVKLLNKILTFVRQEGILLQAGEYAKLYGALQKLNQYVEEILLTATAAVPSTLLHHEKESESCKLQLILAYFVSYNIRAILLATFPKFSLQLSEAPLSTSISLLHTITSINTIIPDVDNNNELQHINFMKDLLNTCLARVIKAINDENISVSIADACNLLKATSQVPSYPWLLDREADIQQLLFSFNNISEVVNDAALYTVINNTITDQHIHINNNNSNNNNNNNDYETIQHKIKTYRPKLVHEYLLSDARWHRIAGRLAVKCALQNDIKFASYRVGLIDSSWSLSKLGHTFRPLLRRIRRLTQFTLHELTSKSLAHLVVAVAAEEGNDINIDTSSSATSTTILPAGNIDGERGREVIPILSTVMSAASAAYPSVKLNHEFVDQVALGALRKLKEIHNIEEFFHTIVATASLGRLSSYSTKSIEWKNSALYSYSNSDNNYVNNTTSSLDISSINNDISNNLNITSPTNIITTMTTANSMDCQDTMRLDSSSIIISIRKLKYLSLSKLIKLQWAIGRLPSGIINEETLQNINSEITKRHQLSITKNNNNMNNKYTTKLQYNNMINNTNENNISSEILTSIDNTCIDHNVLSSYDVLLLLKTLVDNKNKYSEIQKNEICNSILPYIDDLSSNNNSNNSEYKYNSNKLDFVGMDIIIQQELMMLIEMLHSFIDLNWYNKGVIIKIQTFLDKYNNHFVLTSNDNCSIQFNYGTLEELLYYYKLKCNYKPSESIFKFGGRILSKFFRINSH